MILKTFFVYDPNCRVYKRDEKGRSYGGPIYRKSWRIRTILSETSRSWVDSSGIKWNKKTFSQPMNEKELDEICWVDDNSHHIGDKVKRVKDFKLLTKIAELIKYTPSITQ